MLKEIRESRNISQKELADELNVSQATISRYEKGKRKLSTEMFGEICEALKVPQKQRMEMIREFSKRKED